MASHQTVRLSRGSHGSPDEGVCVMELASMLAGEKFSDRPHSVSPVIRGFLRTYNDRLDDERRQDLYAYAARAVGTRAPRSVERARARRCVAWARQRGASTPAMLSLRPLWLSGCVAARYAADQVRTTNFHRTALALVDELISFADSPSVIPADPGELAARSAPSRPDREATA